MLLSTLIHIFAIIIHCTEGSYGQGNPSSCPVNCDVLGEIDSLRQLINQEGLFRMNLDRQLNDLKDITKSISEERGLLEEKVLRLENETLASSSGRRIAFSVTISDGHVNTVADQIIKFDRAFVNEGNSYDPSSGTFTCPENGLYHFSWDVLKVGVGAGLDVDFYVNHRRTFVTWVPGTEKYESRTGTLILNLSMGDMVYLKTRQDGRQLHGSIGGAGYCIFNGLKL